MMHAKKKMERKRLREQSLVFITHSAIIYVDLTDKVNPRKLSQPLSLN